MEERPPTQIDLDDAIRGFARVEATPAFATRVRTRLESGEAGPSPLWPRLALGMAVASIALVLWFAVPHREAPVTEIASRPAATPPPARTAALAQAPLVEPVARRVPRVRRTAPRPTADHERALPALAAPARLDVPGIDPPSLEVSAMAIEQLAPPSTLAVHDLSAGGAGPGDRR
jgi:hypothetical protein